MALQRDLKEFMAGLTWPLRGRKVTMQAEKQIREDLEEVRRQVWQVNSERAHAEDRLRDEIAVLRNDVSAFRQEIQQFQSQLDGFRQSLERSLVASEKITRGNFSFLFDKLTKLQQTADALAKRVPELPDDSIAAPASGASLIDSSERE
jgi:uncharacterized coiled-coil DUF342 family protein